MNIKMKGIAGRWKRATGQSAVLNMSSFSTGDIPVMTPCIYRQMLCRIAYFYKNMSESCNE